MVRNYKNKTNRQAWSTKAMNDAIEAVISGQCGCKKASNLFHVLKSTLERYVKKEGKTLTAKSIQCLGI